VSKRQRLCVSLLVLGWLAWKTDWGQVHQAFVDLRWELWAAAVGLYIVTQCVSGLRWQLLARPLGFDRPLSHFIGFYFIGMYFNLFLPTSMGGDVVRAWYLDNRSGHRLNALLSVFVDRLSGLLLLLLLACIATTTAPMALPVWISWSVWGCTASFLLGCAILPAIGAFTQKYERLNRLAEGLNLYRRRPGLFLATSGLSLLVQVANIALVWLVGLALNAPIPGSYYWILVPMVTLLTLAPVSLNGMGIREGGTVLFLTPLGVTHAMAVSLAFLWFAVFSAAALLGGGLYLFGRFPRPGMESNDETFRDSSDQGRTGQSRAAA